MAPENVTSGPDTATEDLFPPPPLPPRRKTSEPETGQLQAKATIAISPIDIQTLSFPDGSRGTFSTSLATSGYTSPVTRGPGSPGGELSEAMSIVSFAPSSRPQGDLASLVAGEMNRSSRAWNLLRSQSASVQPFERINIPTPKGSASFEEEFEPIPEDNGEDMADDARLLLWKSKLKHYMILSSAGKPIYSRHGDLSLINSYMGVVQTIISFYEEAKNPLLGFTAGNARFVITTEGPLYFLAISRLGESDAQLRTQLDALYMQILSTLTLPTLKSIFIHRPSSDLRKPLEGTDSLLSSLADSFTRGSPSVMLGALECLRLRKSQRHTINNAFLKARGEKQNLLYGLIVAGGKLVSVIRPRRHSLHPSDLHLIFNMLFESGGIQAGGGENWVPLCLPAFNSSGYLYMYVSYFGTSSDIDSEPTSPNPGSSSSEAVAIVLISTDKESFFDLQEMRNEVTRQLTKNGSLAIIQAAVKAGRPKMTAIAPGTQISHFIYKSRANVQFCMASLAPAFEGPGKLEARRRLMTLYHQIHASVHAKNSHLKIMHSIGDDAASLGWITPVFEFYCVAGPNASRAVLTHGANKIIQWAKREEERLFIIGGGVF